MMNFLVWFIFEKPRRQLPSEALGFLLPKQVEDKQVWKLNGFSLRTDRKACPGVKLLITEDLG